MKQPANMKRSIPPTGSDQRMAKADMASWVIRIVVPNG
jgi:hypothetical protein